MTELEDNRKSNTVLFYAPILGRGGAHRFSLDLLHNLIRSDQDRSLKFLALAHERDEFGEPIAWPEGTLIALEPPILSKLPAPPDFRFRYLQRYNATWFRRLQCIVDQYSVDVVYLPQPWFTLRIPDDQVRLNAHIALTLYDFAFDILDWQGTLADAFREEAAAFARHASHTVFFSKPTRDYGLSRYGFPEERTSVIWPAPFLPPDFDTSPEAVTAARTRYSLPEEYILAFHCVGHKRPSTVIEALSILRKQRPAAYRPLVLAGLETDRLRPGKDPGDPYAAMCQKLITDSGLQLDKDIFFLGKVPDDLIGGLFAGASVSVSATQSEAGINGTVFETFAARTPLVYSAIPPYIDRLGENRKYGIHFKLDDAAACASAIRDTLDDKPAREARARAAFTDFIEGYTWKHSAEQYIALFKSLSEQKPPLAHSNTKRQPQVSCKWEDFTARPTIRVSPPDAEGPAQVLIYAPLVGRGGVRRLTEQLLNTWLEVADPDRWRFRVLSQPYDEVGKEITWPKGLLIPLQSDTPQPTQGPVVFEYLIKNRDNFYSQLKRHATHADLIWLPHPWWTLRLEPRTVGLDAHVVPTVHDFAFDHLGWFDSFGDGFRNEFRNFVRLCSKVIFSSRTNYDYAVKQYDLDPAQGEVVYLGDFIPEGFCERADPTAARQKYNLPDEYFFSFHCTGHKDPLTIIEALAKLRRENSAHFRPLVIAGVETETMIPGSNTGNHYAKKVQERIGQLGLVLNRDLYILGFVDDVYLPGLYGGANACITASRSEAGLSATIFETFAACRPLIFSDLPQFVERLGLEKSYGLHFKLGDAHDLARALVEVMNDTDAAHKRILNAKRFFDGRTWRQIAFDYLRVFDETIMTAARGRASRSEMVQASSVEAEAPMPDKEQTRPPAATIEAPAAPQRSGLRRWIHPVKATINEQWLPKINLTSFNSLKRMEAEKDGHLRSRIETTAALTRLQMQHTQLLDERERILEDQTALQQRLPVVVAERDRLAICLSTLTTEKETLENELRRLQDDNEASKQEKEILVKRCRELENRRDLWKRQAIRKLAAEVRAKSRLDRVRQITERLLDKNNLCAAWHLLEVHFGTEPDNNYDLISQVYTRALASPLPYWDIRAACRALSAELRPETYLEVGVRKGWSLAQVLEQSPGVRAFGFDLWIADYAGAQGDPTYVREKMRAVVGTGSEPTIEFISGNSHDAIPRFFNNEIPLASGSAPQQLDLIAVDGDHTLQGAWWDLSDLFPRVKIGGALIFDDLDSEGEKEMTYTTSQFPRAPLPEGVGTLGELWEYFRTKFPNFVFLDCHHLRFRAGVAIKIC